MRHNAALLRRAIHTAVCALALLAPSAASAAKLTTGSASDQLVFFDDLGESNEMTVRREVFPGSGNDELTFTETAAGIDDGGSGFPSGCSGDGIEGSSTNVFCDGYDSSGFIVVSGGSGPDSITTIVENGTISLPTATGFRAAFATIPFVLLGGPGTDEIQGGGGVDLIDTGPDPAETITGGDGVDLADFSRRGTAAINASLDGSPNDGQAGEGDQILADVEGILGGPGPDRIAGGNYPSRLAGGPGDDVLLGGSAGDGLEGGPGNDYIAARDGVAEAVSCGPGGDFVFADPADSTTADCETVAHSSLSPSTLPPPSLGRTFNLLRVDGTVFIRVNGRLFRLTEAIQVPSGARIDARKGRVTVTAERKGPGATDVFTFSKGIFRLTQSRRTGITQTGMRGGSFRNCVIASGASARPPLAETARRRKRRIRRLFGRGRGRFRTRGAFGSATVRGTRYRVVDRCDGTLFRVTQGGIRVRSFELKKSKLLTTRTVRGRRFPRLFLAPADTNRR